MIVVYLLCLCFQTELNNARSALCNITWNRICKLFPCLFDEEHAVNSSSHAELKCKDNLTIHDQSLGLRIEQLLKSHGVPGVQCAGMYIILFISLLIILLFFL
jgi:hypothetical protein